MLRTTLATINKPITLSPDFKFLIILSKNEFTQAISEKVKYANNTLTIINVLSLQDLLALSPEVIRCARLIGFGTDIIVPGIILKNLKFGAYNFHPGPPSHPGWAPFCFAVYDRAEEFGATAHIMIEKVDAGPIVGTALFPVPPDATPGLLANLSRIAGIHLFGQLAPALANRAEPLPALQVEWGRLKRRRTDLMRMCDVPANLDDQEKAHRLRSFSVDDPSFPTPRIVEA